MGAVPGLLIRDFFKEYRELRFTTSGSFELSEIEHNAYLNRLTVQIDEIDSQRYLNRKTLPDHSHYGYLTMFKGTSVIERVPVEFPKQRVFEKINQGVWNYHHANEGLSLPMIGLGNQVARYAKRVADFLEDPDPVWIWEVPDYTIIDSISDLPVLELIFPDYEGIEGTEGDQPPANYRAFPIASPFPDIFKFKGDIPLSFRFRLESWYLVNPSVYIVDNPTDTGDETEGEDEYHEPEIGDGDGDGSEFPDPDPRPSGRDPRDFGNDGSDPMIQVLVKVFVSAYQEGCVEYGETEQRVFPFEGSLNYSLREELDFPVGSACPNDIGKGRLVLVSPNGLATTWVNAVLRSGSRIVSVEILN